MRIETLREFIELADDLDFRAAAQRLHLSVSSLSSHIASLEKEVGVPLIVRWPNRMLTPQGNQFLKYAVRIVGLYDEALKRCSDDVETTKRRVRVAGTNMSPLLRRAFLALLAECSRQRPDIDVSCTMLNTAGGNVQALLNASVDIAFVATTAGDPTSRLAEHDIEFAPVCREEVAAWVARESRLAEGPLTIEKLDLCRFPLIGGASSDNFRADIKTSMSAAGVTPIFSPYYTESFGDYVLNAFGKDDVFVANRSFFENIAEFNVYPDRIVVPFTPPVYVTSYLGRRKSETSHAVIEVFDYLVTYATEHGLAGLERP